MIPDPERFDRSAFPIQARFEKLLRLAIGFFSVFFILLFLYAALRRMRYPFELEWIESGMLVSVRRIAQGLPLYTRPTLDFVPFLYAPLYLYLAAALTKLTGVSYATLRLLSTLSTLGSFAVIYAFIYSETRHKFPALAGAGLFAACYQVSGAWYDLGRVDSLFVFLFLLAIYCTRRYSPLLAAAVWILAFQTKQTILPIAVFMLCANWQQPRRVIAGLVAFLVGVFASIALLNHLTDGWYNFYVFGATRGLPVVWRQASLYLPNDLLMPLGISFLLVLAALLFAPPAHPLQQWWRSQTFSFYVIASFGMYAAIGFVRAHRGATTNSIMPALAWTAILFGFALHRLLLRLQQTDTESATRGRLLLLSAAFVQIFMLMYNPGQYIPPAPVLAARNAFIQQLRELPGDVYVFSHSYDEILAGKQPHAELEALGAILDEPGVNPARDRVTAEFLAALKSHRFSALVIDGPPNIIRPGESFVPADFFDLYPLAFSAVGADQAKFLTSQPQWILMPCSGLHGSYINEHTYMMASGCADSR